MKTKGLYNRLQFTALVRVPKPLHYMLCVFLCMGLAVASDFQYVFDSVLLVKDEINLTNIENAENLEYINDTSNSSQITELKKLFDKMVEPYNPIVNKEALRLAAKFPGELSIDQVCSIYNYLKYGDSAADGWKYVNDPRGPDQFRFANYTIVSGKDASCSGIGDCDDFAILMAALLESIGGTARVMLSHNDESGGHAYTEVYLGNLSSNGNSIRSIIIKLMQKYNVEDVFVHINSETGEVWLNLDWGPDENGNAHPGGPFFQGDSHKILLIRDNLEKIPLNGIETVFRTKEMEDRFEMGKSFAAAGRYEEAINNFNKVIAADGQDAQAWYEKGKALIKLNESEEAFLAYDEALEIDPTYSDAWLGKGNALFGLHKFDEAIIAYDRCIDLDPLNAETWTTKGAALAVQERYEEAIQAHDRAIKINPLYTTAWFNKACALGNAGRYEEAIQCLDKENEINPSWEGWYFRGICLMAIGKTEEANISFQKAKEF